MKGSNELIKVSVNSLIENIKRTGDPLGITAKYWLDWSDEMHLLREGPTVLFTSRMYQMMPYIIKTTKIAETLKPLLKIKRLNNVIRIGNKVGGQWIIRAKGQDGKTIKEKGDKTLKGIVKGLAKIGVKPSYLFENEPYSGVLMHDLGADDLASSYLKTVCKLFNDYGTKEIITCDPHTTHLFKNVYHNIFKEYDIDVKHYIELLSENIERLVSDIKNDNKKSYVIHDSCVMTRDLGIVEQQRKILTAMGFKILECENSKLNTDCCGGPIEYAFNELSKKISLKRAKDLKKVSNDIIVFCPICLINLIQFQSQLGIKIWDFGELLYEILDLS